MMTVETNMHIRYPRIFCVKVRGNGVRAIVSAKLISVFPYDVYSVSFNNCNTAASQASSRSCRILFRKYPIKGLNQ